MEIDLYKTYYHRVKAQAEVPIGSPEFWHYDVLIMTIENEIDNQEE